MKKYLFSSMLLGGLMMASCSENVLETPQVEETQKTYAQKFQEMLGGPVSRTQDFNTLQEFKLNVTLAEAGDIKVYARVNSEVVYQLVGNFENMAAGTHELVVDGPENWNDLENNSHYSGYVWLGDSTNYFCIASEEFRDLPNQGNSIFLEIDYKCDEVQSSIALVQKLKSLNNQQLTSHPTICFKKYLKKFGFLK